MATFQIEVQDIVKAVLRGLDAQSVPPYVKRGLSDAYNLYKPEISDAASHCIDRFIDAELDYTTAGDCGLGRTTADLPRLAARNRSSIAGLNESGRAKLGTMIKRHIASGYLHKHVNLLVESLDESGKPKKVAPAYVLTRVSLTDEELFERWIPWAYTLPFPKETLKEEALFAGSIASGTRKDLEQHLTTIGIALEKIDGNILTWYFTAGINLRIFEGVPSETMERLKAGGDTANENSYQRSMRGEPTPTRGKPTSGCVLVLAGALVTAVGTVAGLYML